MMDMMVMNEVAMNLGTYVLLSVMAVLLHLLIE